MDQMIQHRLESTTCCECGTKFAIDENLLAKRRKDGQFFYCPNGHALHFGNSVEKVLRERLAKEETEHRATKNSANYYKRSRNATRGQLANAKMRAAAGVCPCCNRQFQNVVSHMKCKHPEFNPA